MPGLRVYPSVIGTVAIVPMLLATGFYVFCFSDVGSQYRGELWETITVSLLVALVIPAIYWMYQLDIFDPEIAIDDPWLFVVLLTVGIVANGYFWGIVVDVIPQSTRALLQKLRQD